MAYLSQISVPPCGYGWGCDKEAVYDLYGVRNAKYGSYCAKHGPQALKKLEANEKRDAERGIEAPIR